MSTPPAAQQGSVPQRVEDAGKDTSVNSEEQNKIKQEKDKKGKKEVREPDRILIPGKPDFERCNNKIKTARYSALTFLPVVRQANRSSRSLLLPIM